MTQSFVIGGWRSGLTSSLTVSAIALSGSHVLAQITPDDTLGAESSVVTPLNPQVDRIEGGAIRGTSLFHSFVEFNIDEGRGAYFDNPVRVGTIFSRVTGSNPSNLFGTLGVLGEANLFFLNPNGILFGPNASLDLKGSFVASTASSLTFSDGMQYSNEQSVIDRRKTRAISPLFLFQIIKPTPLMVKPNLHPIGFIFELHQVFFGLVNLLF